MISRLLNKMVIEKDKANHAFYGLFIFVFLSLISVFLFNHIADEKLIIIVVFVTTAGFHYLKEIWDGTQVHHTKDKMDFVWSVAPSLILVAIVYGLF